MATAPPRRARRFLRGLLRRSLRLVLVGAGVLVFGAFGLYFTRERTLFPLLVRATPWFGAQFGGLQLDIRQIEGDLRRTLVLRDVALSADGVEVDVRELRVTGALMRAARGELAALDSVIVTGLSGRISARADGAEPFEAPWPPLAALPALSLGESALILDTDAGPVELAGLSLQGPARGPYALAAAASFANLAAQAALSLALPDGGQRAELTGAIDVPGWTELTVNGALDGSSGLLHAAPLQLRLNGQLDGAPSAVQALAPDVRRFEGQGEVEVTLAGPLAAPVLAGTLGVTDGRVRAQGLPNIDDLQLALALDTERIRIERAEASLGAAPVRVTGTVGLAAPAPLDLTVTGAGLLLARTGDARFRADVELAVRGAANAPAVSGSVALVGSRVRLEVDLLRALEGALPRRGSGAGARPSRLELPALGPAGATLDVLLSTRDVVRVQGNVARGALRADLRLTGDAALPVLVGQVFVDPLELALPAATVRFERGAVRFTPDQPNVPQLELIGETRIAGHDVTVELLGTYDTPEVRLASNPPLSADQLVLLVVSGRPPAEAGQVTAAGEALAVYVAKDLVRGWFDRGGFDDRQSFLSRIEVVTGRDVSKSGVLTLEASLLVRDRAFGREGGVYTVLERDAYEDYNLGLRFVVRLR